jgi:hypothetical protein
MSKGPLPPDKSLSAAARTSHSLQAWQLLVTMCYMLICTLLIHLS